MAIEIDFKEPTGRESLWTTYQNVEFHSKGQKNRQKFNRVHAPSLTVQLERLS
jgi:hypothetical protein